MHAHACTNALYIRLCGGAVNVFHNYILAIDCIIESIFRAIDCIYLFKEAQILCSVGNSTFFGLIIELNVQIEIKLQVFFVFSLT